MDQEKCKHERTRPLDCEEHGKDCEIIICCDCGETIEETNPEETVKSLTGIKNAVLKHGKVWLTMDGKSWVYVEKRRDDSLWINYGLDDNEATSFHAGLTQIFDFLSFKRSTDLL